MKGGDRACLPHRPCAEHDEDVVPFLELQVPFLMVSKGVVEVTYRNSPVIEISVRIRIVPGDRK